MIIKCDIAPGMLTSVVYDHVEARLATTTKDWPAGYHFQFGGEKEEQGKDSAPWRSRWWCPSCRSTWP